tara:strand:+ start:474 stop:800 length:327 start_codon:yes stop_codon:yes gene_type:complete
VSDTIKIKLSSLKLIYDYIDPISHKLNSILEDVVQKKYMISEPHRAVLLEYCANVSTLKILFEDYFERNEKSELLDLDKQEYTILLNLAKSVEMSTRAALGNIALWNN